jgi:hypothetical protein
MRNLDDINKQKTQIFNDLTDAVKTGDEEKFAKSFTDLADTIQQAVIAEAQGTMQVADNTILAGRGVRVLTNEENNYYQKVISAMKSDNPKQALSGFNDVLPKTIIDAIFEDITESHPLLNVIQFKNAESMVEYLYSSMNGRFKAVWGKLCGEITRELSASFHKISFGQNKLSAFIPICKAMLDLGPAWLDRYVRAIFIEAIANGFEDGVINGRGVADGAENPANYIYEPIGMIRDLSTYNVTNGYAAKDAIPISDFSPAGYGGLISQLAVGPNGLNRNVTEVILIVNPVDYLTKIFPATTHQTLEGGYVSNIFPFPTKVIQSAYMEQGKAVIGIADRYLAVLGTGRDGKIDYSDEYQFLEDDRIYLTKLYGTGRPIDNNCFLLLDISDLVPAYPGVNVNNWPPVVTVDGEVDAAVTNDPLNVYGVADARLASLEIGSLDLSPEFNKSVFVYTATTSNASDTITAVAKDSESLITIKNGEATVANGAEATWVEGTNVVTVTVLRGGETETYTVTVTYTPAA